MIARAPKSAIAQQAGGAGDGVVDAGRGAGVALVLDRRHDGRRQRRDGERHPEAERPGSPGKNVVQYEPPIDGRAKRANPHGDGQRADDERHPRAEAVGERAGPSREERHRDDERQQRRAGLRRRVVLHLDEVERQEEQRRRSSAA